MCKWGLLGECLTGVECLVGDSKDWATALTGEE